jgi:hypothetical protein
MEIRRMRERKKPCQRKREGKISKIERERKKAMTGIY